MKAFAVSAVALWVAAILQQALPDRMALGAARPDFLLILAICLGLLLPSPGSMIAGFFTGLLQGALVGANLAQFVLSRMLTAWIASRVAELEIEIGIVLAALFTGLGTLFAQVLMMFLAPPRSLETYIAATIGSALYNAVLAVPVYAALRPLLRKSRA